MHSTHLTWLKLVLNRKSCRTYELNKDFCEWMWLCSMPRIWAMLALWRHFIHVQIIWINWSSATLMQMWLSNCKFPLYFKSVSISVVWRSNCNCPSFIYMLIKIRMKQFYQSFIWWYYCNFRLRFFSMGLRFCWPRSWSTFFRDDICNSARKKVILIRPYLIFSGCIVNSTRMFYFWRCYSTSYESL